MDQIIYFLPLVAVVGFIFIAWKSAWVSKQDIGNERMATIAKHISDGAMAFLKAEYRILAVFVVAVAVLLFVKSTNETSSNGYVVISFISGALLSALAGYIGMRIATKANVRTTRAAQTSLNKALEVAFNGGSVMGIGVVHLAFWA